MPVKKSDGKKARILTDTPHKYQLCAAYSVAAKRRIGVLVKFCFQFSMFRILVYTSKKL